MLQIFHTADWHLGQSFHNHDRQYEHQQFLDWLLEQLQTHQPDALILAGDVFDTINPSAAAQKQYYRFLNDAQQARPGLQMVITAGNHDAGSRLEAPRDLLETFRIHVVGTVPRNDAGAVDPTRLIVPITDQSENIAAYVLAVPFLRPSDLPAVPTADDPWLEGIRRLYQQATQQAVQLRNSNAPNAAIIAMGHCHFSGGEESPDSERRLIIGQAECIGSEAFPPELTYTALGHLHRAQEFDDGRIRYSGSPIPLSFSERSYSHRVLQLFIDGSKLQRVDKLMVPRAVPMLRLPETGAATAAELLQQLQQLDLPPDVPQEQQPFLELHLQEDKPNPGFRNEADQIVESQAVRLVSIKRHYPDRSGSEAIQPSEGGLDQLAAIRPEDVFCSHWRDEFNTEPDAAVLQVLREILLEEEVQR